MADAYGILAQAVGTGSASSILTVGAGETKIIREIWIANDSGSSQTYQFFLDNDGTTYDSTTKVTSVRTIETSKDHMIQCRWTMNNSAGNLAVNAPAGLTITLFGVTRS